MINQNNKKMIIGRAAYISLPEITAAQIPARVDTGAKTSAIWVEKVEETAEGLLVTFFGHSSPLFDGKTHVFSEYQMAVIVSSNGQKEKRYKIKLKLKLAGKTIRASFTLADRSTQVYPVLLGRNVLLGKFLVDVKVGDPLLSKKNSRSGNELNQLEQEGETV